MDMMSLVRVGDAPDPVVTLQELKAQLRVFSDAENDLITSLGGTAEALLEGPKGMLGRALLTQTWEMRIDRFPRRYIEMPLPPLQSVVWIKYLDAAGVEQTLAPTEYVVDTGLQIGRIRPAYQTCWPQTQPFEHAVRIQFKAGYGDTAADVPKVIKQAVKMLTLHWFYNRGDVGTPTPAVYALVSGERIEGF